MTTLKDLKTIEDLLRKDDAVDNDEINARVYSYIHDLEIVYVKHTSGKDYNYWASRPSDAADIIGPDYATSIDAQAEIMPDKWAIGIVPWTNNGKDLTSFTATLVHHTHDYIATGEAKTEPRARLLAIVLVWILEAENNG